MNPAPDRIILIVTAVDSSFEAFERAVTRGSDGRPLRRARDLDSGLARLAGGGIHTMVLDVSNGKLAALRKVREVAPNQRVVLWSDAEDPRLPQWTREYEAAGYLTRATLPQDLTSLFTASESRPSDSAVIAVMGAKGGVGATTVATNVAAALTAKGAVILAELRDTFGTVQSVLYPGQVVRGIAQLRPGAPIAPALWPAPTVPGLRVLFGPQTAEDCGRLPAEQASRVLQQLGHEANYVVLDLPPALSAANRALIEASRHLALVVRPVPACLRLAKLMLKGIANWEKSPAGIGVVVVKSSAEGDSIPPSQIEDELGTAILKVIPPAPELCRQAEHVHRPLIQCDPDSLAAENLDSLAHCFLTRSSLRGPRPRLLLEV